MVCGAAQGVLVTTSAYHNSIGVEVPPWPLATTWRQPMVRFDNVVRSVWVLFQVRDPDPP